MATINLVELTENKVSMLAGMPRGIAARKEFDLNAFDESDETVTVVAPDSLDAISPSFVQGFLAESLRSLGGRVNLKKKYVFEMADYLIEDINIGLDRAAMRRKIAGHD